MKKFNHLITTYIKPEGTIDKSQFLIAAVAYFISYTSGMVYNSGHSIVKIIENLLSSGIITKPSGGLLALLDSLHESYSHYIPDVFELQSIFAFILTYILIISTIKYCRSLNFSVKKIVLLSIGVFLFARGYTLILYSIASTDWVFMIFTIPFPLVGAIGFFYLLTYQGNKTDKEKFLSRLFYFNFIIVFVVNTIFQMIYNYNWFDHDDIRMMIQNIFTYIYPTIAFISLIINLILILPHLTADTYSLRKYVIPFACAYTLIYVLHCFAFAMKWYTSSSILLANIPILIMHKVFIVMMISLVFYLEFGPSQKEEEADNLNTDKQ